MIQMCFIFIMSTLGHDFFKRKFRKTFNVFLLLARPMDLLLGILILIQQALDLLVDASGFLRFLDR